MAFIVALLFAMPLLAWAIVRGVWLFRLRHIDPDNEAHLLPDEKQFMQRATLILAFLLVACIPLLYQGYAEMRLKHQLLRLPLVEVMRKYRPLIYQSFVRDVQHAQARAANDEQAVAQISGQYVHELRLQWQRDVPYASLDAVMRYIRYRYNEADVLSQINDDICRNIDLSERNTAGMAASVSFMQRNAAFVEAVMTSVFDSANSRYRMNYLEQRTAVRQYRVLLSNLNQRFDEEMVDNIEQGGCAFQKAFYLALMDYHERDMSRIMRWVLLQQIAEADRQELLDGK